MCHRAVGITLHDIPHQSSMHIINLMEHSQLPDFLAMLQFY